MIPKNFYFGGGASETMMGPVAAVMIIMAVIALLVLPRKYAIIPAVLAIFLIPRGEVLVLAGFHFLPERIIALFGLIRVFWLRFVSHIALFSDGINSIDRVFLGCAVAHSLAFILLWQSMAAVNNQSGFLLGTIGMYVLLRCLIKNEADIYRLVKVFVFIAAMNAVAMLYEKAMVQNLFGVLIGGTDPVPLVREGSVRAQGAFGHPILGGTYGATVLPLFALLWVRGRARTFAVVGIISSMIMVLTAVSSTPLIALFGIVIGICFWPLRRKMRLVRWSVALGLIALDLVMKAPVWFLIARVDIVGGSASYDRAKLIDVFIKHFSDWWLLGTRDVANWGWSMWDLSDTYVSQGESGGLVALVLFIAIICFCFSKLGKARLRAKGSQQEWFLWLIGVALFANLMAFFGVSYWDQTEVAWFALLAIISAATAPILARKKEPGDYQIAPPKRKEGEAVECSPHFSLAGSSF